MESSYISPAYNQSGKQNDQLYMGQ